MRPFAVAILRLLDDSPVTRDSVKVDVREFVAAGELELAFDLLCSWIYEDELEIDRAYHSRLVELTDVMVATEIVAELSALVREKD